MLISGCSIRRCCVSSCREHRGFFLPHFLHCSLKTFRALWELTGGNGKVCKHCVLLKTIGEYICLWTSSVAQIISVKMYTVHIPKKHSSIESCFNKEREKSHKMNEWNEAEILQLKTGTSFLCELNLFLNNEVNQMLRQLLVRKNHAKNNDTKGQCTQTCTQVCCWFMKHSCCTCFKNLWLMTDFPGWLSWQPKVRDSLKHNYVPRSPCLCLIRTFKRPISTVNDPHAHWEFGKITTQLIDHCRRLWIWLCFMQLMFKMLSKSKENCHSKCFKQGSAWKRSTLDDYQLWKPKKNVTWKHNMMPDKLNKDLTIQLILSKLLVRFELMGAHRILFLFFNSWNFRSTISVNPKSDHINQTTNRGQCNNAFLLQKTYCCVL